MKQKGGTTKQVYTRDKREEETLNPWELYAADDGDVVNKRGKADDLFDRFASFSG